MKSFVCAAFLLTFFVQLSAQGRRSDVESKLMIKAGYNAANITIDNNGSVDKSNQFGSFHFGLICDLPFNKYISFQGGALFLGKGAKTAFGTPGQVGHFTAITNPQYIEVPMNIVLKLPLGGKHAPRLFAGAGPYFAMGITGANKTQLQTATTIVYSNRDINFDGGKTSANPIGYPSMKRFDYGANAQVGVELQHLVLSVGYDYGMAKLVPGTTDNADDKGKNRVLLFSVGFKL